MQDIIIKFGIALVAYSLLMFVRHAYLGYAKYPKLIRHYRQIGDEENVSKSEQIMRDCRSRHMWRFLLLAVIASLCIGVIQWMAFIQHASEASVGN